MQFLVTDCLNRASSIPTRLPRDPKTAAARHKQPVPFSGSSGLAMSAVLSAQSSVEGQAPTSGLVHLRDDLACLRSRQADHPACGLLVDSTHWNKTIGTRAQPEFLGRNIYYQYGVCDALGLFILFFGLCFVNRSDMARWDKW